MSMEKFGVKSSDLRNNLIYEERDLKQKIAGLRSRGEKTASTELQDSEKKLLQIREKITELEAGMTPPS